jgi:hypothetical protein
MGWDKVFICSVELGSLDEASSSEASTCLFTRFLLFAFVEVLLDFDVLDMIGLVLLNSTTCSNSKTILSRFFFWNSL